MSKSWAVFSFHWRRDSTTAQLSSIIVHTVKKIYIYWCALLLPFAGWQKTRADGRKRGGGGGTDVNTDKGWFECASSAKSGGGGDEWQKRKERKKEKWQPVEKRRRDRSEGS